MIQFLQRLRHSLMFKVTLTAGLTLLLGILTWAVLSVNYYRTTLMDNVVHDIDRLTNTIRLGTHYSMMLDSREDIRQIINNVSRQKGIESIRIYNKLGEIMFSNQPGEVGKTTDVKEKACYVCHKKNPPSVRLSRKERTRSFTDHGDHLLGIISPIYNEPGCSGGPCHVHPRDKKVLGLLDVVVSLKTARGNLADFRKKTGAIAFFIFMATFGVISLFIVKFINNPIRKLIQGTRFIAENEAYIKIDVNQDDEMGKLASAITKMSRDIAEKHAELNRQRDEYRRLFELVPCLITVQDRDYRLVSYNKEFATKFSPTPGDYCFSAYKGRTEKCPDCPVEKTFADGRSHVSEEAGYNRDGSRAHWLVTTSPIRDSEGNIVAAMEVSLDITQHKLLEEELARSEAKYQAIFTNIPNAVFVLDAADLTILDCNEVAPNVYCYDKEDMVGRSFLELFWEGDRDQYADKLKKRAVVDKARQRTGDGRNIYTSIRVSPAAFPGGDVLLAATSDITKRLETEQNLIQASKMATLGEMATGVAHEINQPLAVIKTASAFFMKKINRGERIEDKTLEQLATEIDSYVDRATKIINHMREFGRKPEIGLVRVDLNTVISKAFELFSQQLKLRMIEVRWDLEEDLPQVMGDSSRLEQVFVNLLINARDAIEDRSSQSEVPKEEKVISISSFASDGRVAVSVSDAGVGIPAAIRDRIFEPFFTTKEVGKGTGLGLSISYTIVADCGGTITARENDLGGTTFEVAFPAAASRES
jgi:histidine kinase